MWSSQLFFLTPQQRTVMSVVQDHYVSLLVTSIPSISAHIILSFVSKRAFSSCHINMMLEYWWQRRYTMNDFSLESPLFPVVVWSFINNTVRSHAVSHNEWVHVILCYCTASLWCNRYVEDKWINTVGYSSTYESLNRNSNRLHLYLWRNRQYYTMATLTGIIFIL